MTRSQMRDIFLLVFEKQNIHPDDELLNSLINIYFQGIENAKRY
jgi:hypothetical protein